MAFRFSPDYEANLKHNWTVLPSNQSAFSTYTKGGDALGSIGMSSDRFIKCH